MGYDCGTMRLKFCRPQFQLRCCCCAGEVIGQLCMASYTASNRTSCAPVSSQTASKQEPGAHQSSRECCPHEQRAPLHPTSAGSLQTARPRRTESSALSRLACPKVCLKIGTTAAVSASMTHSLAVNSITSIWQSINGIMHP